MAERDVTSKLLKIAKDGNEQAITGLLNSGADIQGRSKDGSTPLHIAAYYENTDGVQTLLGAGADIQALSEDGSTPLHDAGVENGTGGSVTLLLVAGANIEARTRDRATLCIELLPMARQRPLPPL